MGFIRILNLGDYMSLDSQGKLTSKTRGSFSTPTWMFTSSMIWQFPFPEPCSLCTDLNPYHLEHEVDALQNESIIYERKMLKWLKKKKKIERVTLDQSDKKFWSPIIPNGKTWNQNNEQSSTNRTLILWGCSGEWNKKRLGQVICLWSHSNKPIHRPKVFDFAVSNNQITSECRLWSFLIVRSTQISCPSQIRAHTPLPPLPPSQPFRFMKQLPPVPETETSN